ncbi:MAG TPA: MFS transporter, partial [Micropepsaceae bacterium]|nr:MFS transporter [Micropepsaceae bacterium]
LEARDPLQRRSVIGELASRNVVFLSLAYFGLVASLNANTTWTPQIVRAFAGSANLSLIGVIAAIPAIIAAAAMPVWGLHSDRHDERPWHLVLPLLLAAVGWLLIVASDLASLQLLGLIAATTGNYCAMAMFWTIPASAAILSPGARPAGIALINSVGQVGAAISSPVVGALKDFTGSFTSGLLFVTAMLLVAAFFGAAAAQHVQTPGRQAVR